MNDTVRRIFALIAFISLVGIGCNDDKSNGPETRSDVAEDIQEVDGRTEDGGETETDSVEREPLYNDVEINGLSSDVTIRFDEQGTLHIECVESNDCFAAQGYVHAQQRFFQMDMIRRQTLGRLSEVLGGFALEEEDVFWRKIMTTRQGRPLEELYLEALDDETRKILEAYARGVNAWIDDVRNNENGASMTQEFDSPFFEHYELDKWRPEDSVAFYLQLSHVMGQSAENDLLRGRAMTALNSDVGKDLFTPRPIAESYTLDASAQTQQFSKPKSSRSEMNIPDFSQAKPAIDRALDTLANSEPLISGGHSKAKGSNSWAVSPSRTEGSGAILANDPHLPLYTPSIWHISELHATGEGEDLHIAGASAPSVPGIVEGHNENIAWGTTTARLDLADAYIEELTNDGEAVMFNGEAVPIKQKEFSFELAGGGEVTRTFEWVPHHGPIISKDEENNRAVTIRWAAQDGNYEDINGFFDLMQADSVDAAMEDIKKIGIINQNFTLMDREGNIGWFPHGRVPSRPWASSETPNWLPLPGDGSAEWQGFLSSEKIPRMVNPAAGYLATANNAFNDHYVDGDPTNDGSELLQSPPTMGYRHQRIVQMLSENDNVSVEDAAAMQGDVLTLHGKRLVPLVLGAISDEGELSPDVQKVKTSLENWDYNCPAGLDGVRLNEATKVSDSTETKESIGCAVFQIFVRELTGAVFADELQPFSEVSPRYQWPTLRWPNFQAALVELFESPDKLRRGKAYFDDVTTPEVGESKTETILSTMKRTATSAEELFDSADKDDWRWGYIHTLVMENLFAEAGIDRYNKGPFVNGGGYFTVDYAPSKTEENNFSHTVGPSVRLVYQATENGIEMVYQLPGGQDNHRDSKHYLDLLPQYLNKSPFKAPFSLSEVKASAEKTVTFSSE